MTAFLAAVVALRCHSTVALLNPNFITFSSGWHLPAKSRPQCLRPFCGIFFVLVAAAPAAVLLCAASAGIRCGGVVMLSDADDEAAAALAAAVLADAVFAVCLRCFAFGCQMCRRLFPTLPPC
ncbi:hypothetical protein KCP76_24630 [Salmonella enterica subsp. enterica serovar Weltevreden]|nr:hypothetical protein KCP76_24630 [Salmonella enterica subsp. enterica serovar Weltevreden]